MLEPESEQILLGLLEALDADDSAIHPGLAQHVRAQVVSAYEHAHSDHRQVREVARAG